LKIEVKKKIDVIVDCREGQVGPEEMLKEKCDRLFERTAECAWKNAGC
jgi:hypothetical protein